VIDIKNILDCLGVDYKESGKNVGANDINIDCPFCGADKHLGVSINEGKVNCWVCTFEGMKKHPSLLKVLLESTGLPYEEIKSVMSENGWEPYRSGTKDCGDGLARRCSLPKETYSFDRNTPISRKALEYLKGRGFNEKTVSKYRLQVAGYGAYGNRIIIPIYFKGKLVSFTSRGFGSYKENRYKHSPLFMSSERMKNLLYNYDSAKKYRKAYLLEGPTDVWQMGDDSMGVFKSALSRPQRNLLMESGIESIVVVYDFKAVSRAYETAEMVSLFIPKVKVVRLDEDRDVADRSREEISQLESEVPFYRG